MLKKGETLCIYIARTASSTTFVAYTGSVSTMHSVRHTAGQKERRVSFTTKDVSCHSVMCEI